MLRLDKANESGCELLWRPLEAQRHNSKSNMQRSVFLSLKIRLETRSRVGDRVPKTRCYNIMPGPSVFQSGGVRRRKVSLRMW